ncbi:MAG: VOC family protein [Candidatus Kapaibacterium sp.]
MKLLSIVIAALWLSAMSASAQQHPGEPSMSTDSPAFRVARVTYAITNVEKMVAFYENVFQMKFESFDGGGTKLYSGMLLGQNTLFCPNTLAGVVAEQNRLQYDIVVSDIDGVAARVRASGGKVREENTVEGRKTMTIVDPDGNTIIFHQAK